MFDYLMRLTDWEEKIRRAGVEMPWIKFPPEWEIQVIHPFGAAVVRFRARKGAAEVSVYADFFGNLGAMNSPYWEVYPHDGDVGRCAIADVEGLLRMIAESFEDQTRRFLAGPAV